MHAEAPFAQPGQLMAYGKRRSRVSAEPVNSRSGGFLTGHQSTVVDGRSIRVRIIALAFRTVQSPSRQSSVLADWPSLSSRPPHRPGRKNQHGSLHLACLTGLNIVLSSLRYLVTINSFNRPLPGPEKRIVLSPLDISLRTCSWALRIADHVDGSSSEEQQDGRGASQRHRQLDVRDANAEHDRTGRLRSDGIADDCRWQCRRSKKRSWGGLPDRQGHRTLYCQPRCIRSSVCRYCCLAGCSGHASCASSTRQETRNHCNSTITSSGWHGKACRSRRSTSCRTVKMANKDRSVASWPRSYAPRSTTSSACFTTTHP